MLLPLREWMEAVAIALSGLGVQDSLPQPDPAALIQAPERNGHVSCPLLAQEAEAAFDLAGVYNTRPLAADPSLAKTAFLGAKRQGCVLVKYDISDDGKPVNIRVVRSFKGAPYRLHAVKTVSGWSFPPDTRRTPGANRADLGVIFHYD